MSEWDCPKCGEVNPMSKRACRKCHYDRFGRHDHLGNRRPVITEEPVMTIHLLNEIRKFCENCDDCSDCAVAKSAGAMDHCLKVSRNRAYLMERAGMVQS